ncbi:MAG TPA: D-glycero-beta-D-manno-heptose 1,7-bisphosphate 7-phosphatase [Gammaproteobacteria bacterium]
MRPPPLVVLDRDGVINEDSDDFIRSVEDWRPIPGSLEGIALLHRAGVRVVVVTNQSGVARGLYTEEVLAAIHARMIAEVEAAGGALAGIYYCPHHPDDGCECRKPKPGLLRRAERELGLPVAGAPFVGDRLTDVEAARAVGARPMLVRTGYGARVATALAPDVEVYADLRAAVAAILGLTS